MSVALCLSLTEARRPVIEATLAALVDVNADLYARRVVDGPPWGLVWVPDQLVVCDATACRIADTSTMRDVGQLYPVGRGSCGSLACAYAGWLRFQRTPRVSVELQHAGKDQWHVVALANGRVYDPARIGNR